MYARTFLPVARPPYRDGARAPAPSAARSADDGHLLAIARRTLEHCRAEIARLDVGQSCPWPEALEAISSQRQMDATAMLDYFAPLKQWLDEKNQGQSCGW